MKVQSSMLAVVGLLVATSAAAQTAEEQVEQGVLSYYEALNDGDSEAWESLFAEQYHGFFGGGETVPSVPTTLRRHRCSRTSTKDPPPICASGIAVYGNTALAPSTHLA